MNEKSRKLLTNVGILTISNFASKILVFLLVPLYTSILTTVEFGIYDLIISTISLLVPILSLNIIDAVMRFLMDKDYPKSKVATIGIKYISYSIVIVVLLLVLINQLDIWQQINGLEIYIFFYYFFYVLNQYFIQLAKGLEQVAAMGITGVLGTLIMITTNVVFLIVFKWGLPGFFLANILSQAIPVLYLFFKTHFWVFLDLGKTDKYLTKNMLVYSTPLIASVIGWWVNSGSDKYIVAFFCGVAVNGVLSVAYKIPSILNTMQGIFIQAWQISAIQEYGETETAKFYGNTFEIINVIMCAACSWLILLTKPLAHMLYAKQFYAAWKFVPFLLISSVLNCVSGILGPILAAKKDSKAMAKSAVYGASVNLILNILFVYFIGAQGVTVATVIASYVIYQIRKVAVGKDIIIENYRYVIITWILLCIQASTEIYTDFWYVEILLMIVMFFLNYSNIRKIFYVLIKRKRREMR